MNYEIAVEGVVLRVEVTSCVNINPSWNTWNSDWDLYGTRELEWHAVSGVTYDDDGVPMDVEAEHLAAIAQANTVAIEREIWFEIDNRGAGRRRAA
ncbi:hypothetical protein EXN22_16335 [Pseudomonas tructae]|uniref:Uncharacterized protein n=1 Tax=Pseudomonas tructae TaxID=2518644 RepID=A0A411MK50_9PSED|nr:hypothetical protein [Pseudomonas tructae]QBF27183.1 hypothetical protein EXN22_16335 [Pseudomonas tructae]